MAADVRSSFELHMRRAHAHEGRVRWIGLRRERKQTPASVEETLAETGTGLAGDHYSGGWKGKREVTLIQQEHLEAVAKILGVESVDPGLVRRNIVVSGLNLQALKDTTFRIGGAVLEYTGPCHPCSRMEHNLGTGGYSAMRGHGGITARVVQEGTIHVGDAVSLAPSENFQQ